MKSQFLKSLLVALLVVFGTHATGYADIIPVPDRTPQVRDAIVAAVLGVNSASDVTETHLATITNLNLRAKGISALKTGDFSGMTNLTNLNLYGNQLSSLPDRIFEGLTALTKLRLGENQLTTLPAGVFSGLTGLRDLYLHNNRLTNLPADVFSGLPALIQINLHTNQLTSLPKGVFSGLSALTQLYLHNNRLATLDAEVFSRLSALQFLFLHNNQLTSLDAEVFSRLSALEFLFLNGNRLTNLSPGMFRGVSTPASLWLQDNVIDPLPLTLLLEKVGENELKVSVPAGAPFSIELPLTVTNGSITGGTTRITVAAGSVESQPVTIIRTPGTTDTVTVEIGTLPNTRSRHKGYALVKSSTLPIEFRSINNAPVFTEGTSTKRTVAENTGSGVNIGSAVSATDADDDTLTYSLSGTDALSFGIDSGSGQLRTSTALDYETKSSYSVTVSVSDGNEGSDSIPVTISVTDVNETPANRAPVFTDVNETPANRAPVFTEGSRTTRTVVENTTSGVNIGSAVSATDADNDTLTYRLGGPDAAFFSIDSTTGQLKTSAALNHETQSAYSVIVKVLDGGLTDTIDVTITVDDVNDAPVFTAGNRTLTVEENTASATNIGNPFTATDEDDDTLTYRLVGSDAGFFSINGSSGQLRTNAVFDYEEDKHTYTVTVSVSDGNDGSASTNVTITVDDVNDAPVFVAGSLTRRIAENTVAGTNIGNPFTATDEDDDTLTYRLVGSDAGFFSINGSSGQLRTNAVFDYEEDKHTYTVTVSVSDGNDGSASINVTITVDDVNDAPVFVAGSLTRRIAENTVAGTNIGAAFTATDPDAGDTLEYSLDGTDASSFDIDSSSGQLKVKAALDYEDKTSYSVRITVSDGDLTDRISVTIRVTDVDDNRAPVFSQDSFTLRIEIDDETAAGDDIGSAFSATDADNDTLTYRLGGTDASSFSIVSSSGQLQTTTALISGTRVSYSITVIADDGNGGSDSIAVTIVVTRSVMQPTNDAPVFTDGDTTTRSIDENTDAGENIGTPVAATDANTSDTLTYTLGGTDAASFSIDSTTGQLQTSAALSHETKSSYTVTVSVSDGNQGSASITVTIRVTDVNEAPVFDDGENTTRAISENVGADINIGPVVAAKDPDGDTLTYSLGGTDAPSFRIGSTTGQLKTTNTELDFETKSAYSVTITVSDEDNLRATISVTIKVTDLDDTPSNNAPVFTDGEQTTRRIAENTVAGTNIGAPVSAIDADNNPLAYVLQGDDAASFSIDSNTGQLKTSAALNHETQSAYSVIVKVLDGGLTDTIDVTITVDDVNEAPVFTTGSLTRRIAENTVAGTNIGATFTATDPDAGDTLEYSLDGTDASSFDIDSSSGQLKVKAALDYEDKTSYSVRITVSDGDLTDRISVTIRVTDVDDNRAPVFSQDSFTLRIEIDDETAAGADIGRAFSATDADNDTLTYRLGGTDAASFDIVRTTGQLQTTAAFISDTRSDYSVIVTATDGNGGSASVDVTVTATRRAPEVTNSAPVFTDGNSTTRTIDENTAADTNIGTPVAATDTNNDTLTYTLGGYNAASFDIDSETGHLKTKAWLDYERKNSYTVTITVSDGSLTDSITVTINVNNVNDAPAFAIVSIVVAGSGSPPVTRSVAENTAAGENIGTPVAAVDQENDTLTYTLSGDDASSFSIDSETGQLKTKAALDYEEKTSYSVTITVSDGSRTDTINVTINVTDVDDNHAPVFLLINITRSIEIDGDTAAGTNIGDPVSATDADNDTLTYTLGGTDATSFDIDSTTGQLQTTAVFISGTQSVYAVTVTATDGNGGSASVDVTVTATRRAPQVTNNAPVFQYGSSITLFVNKGERLGTSIRATDEDDDTLTYSLGGTDASLFSLDEDYEYHLKSNAALDYDGKTSYSVTITVSDGNGGSDTITVTITDPAPEVDILTLIRSEEPDWVLKLDTATGIVRAVKSCPRNPSGPSICLDVTSLRPTYFVSFTRAKGVKFDNSFRVTVKFSEAVSDFEQSELTLTDNTAGATISGWKSQETWSGYVVDADIDVTTSGSVTFNVAAGAATDNAGQPNPAAESKTVTVTINLTEHPPWDVNKDGSVDATDSALVTAALGQTGGDIVNSRTDVNWDDTVDGDDVTLVTYHIADEGAAPSIIRAFSLLDKKTLEKLNPVALQTQLDILRAKSNGSPGYLHAIALLENILAATRPDKTQLLANYPNPFNPETWIPYHLANASNVHITIYNARGTVVQRLELGHQREGYYTSRSRAAYWDGTNNVGERVASGLYFYQLQADNVSLLRKMVILK